MRIEDMTITVKIRNENGDGPLAINVKDETLDAEGKAVAGSNHIVSAASEVTLTLDENRISLRKICMEATDGGPNPDYKPDAPSGD